MSKKERDIAVKAKTDSMTQAVKRLHVLSKTKKELSNLIRERDSHVDHCISKNLNAMREEERKKRIEVYGEIEEKRQQVTSILIMELLKICSEDDVPRYVMAIAKVLDNYQGGINSIRSNSNWLSEIITQLTDQMRSFEAAQTKMNAKFDLVLDKVIKLN